MKVQLNDEMRKRIVATAERASTKYIKRMSEEELKSFSELHLQFASDVAAEVWFDGFQEGVGSMHKLFYGSEGEVGGCSDAE